MGTRLSRSALAAALVLVLAAPGCRWFRRAPKVQPAPGPAPAATKPLPPPEPKPAPEPELLPPPQLPAGEPPIPLPPLATPKPPAPRAPRRTRVVRKPAPPPTPPPEPGEPPRTATPLPQLQQILTPEEQREAGRAFERAESRVEQVLAVFRRQQPTPEQLTSITRIRAFLAQARQLRSTDLLTARALAERAAVLAEDLLKTLR